MRRWAFEKKAGDVDRNSLWSKFKRAFLGNPVRPPQGDITTVDYQPPVGPPGYQPPVGPPEYRRLRVGVASTVGTVREHNEDNFYLPSTASGEHRGGDGDYTREYEYAVSRDEIHTFIVADGMGGQLAGEKASQMAVDLLPKELSRRFSPGESDDRTIQRVIKDAVAAANQEILGLSHIQTEFSNMGTTVVLALFRNNRAYVAGIGDSRAYRIRSGQIEQLTKDHSLADALVEAGTITKEELPNHKFKHILYLYLGSKDARGGPDEVKVAEVCPRDRFLLASDGLTGVVSDEVLTRMVEAGDDPLETARRLVAQAIENQSKDNVTCMVIHAI
jgi:serine/threonine protein phosphatase PrpC